MKIIRNVQQRERGKAKEEEDKQNIQLLGSPSDLSDYIHCHIIYTRATGGYKGELL